MKVDWTTCNRTLELEPIVEEPVWHSVQLHHIGLILSALFGLIAVVVSAFLIFMHATHYLKPYEQRHIIRVLFMVPVYAIVSFVSYWQYQHAVYWETIRDCYEAFAIASFFALLCHYIAPDLHGQKDYFRTLKPKPWVLPISWFRRCCGGERGPWRTPRSGLTWFNIIWLGVFQYCLIRVFMTFLAVITQALGRYCIDSLSPFFAHVWVMVIEGACVTVAMICLIQFYYQLREDLSEHRPLLKMISIKLVIFLSFWQNIIISFLTSSNAIKTSPTVAYPDMKIGIPSLLLCIEMAIFAVFHLFAFPWRVYDVKHSALVASESGPGSLPDPRTAYKGGFLGIKAYADAFNPWDLVKAVGRGFKWAFVGRRLREQDISYKNHGTGLEPTRLDAAFPPNAGVNPAFGAGKNARYHRMDDDEDDNQLLANAQSNPSNTHDPYPSMPTGGDIGNMGRANRFEPGPDDLTSLNPTPAQYRKQQGKQETGVIDSSFRQDTSYKGAEEYPRPNPQLRAQQASTVTPWDEVGVPPGYPPHESNRF